MFEWFFKKKAPPAQQPQQPQPQPQVTVNLIPPMPPNAPVTPLTDEEIQKLRVFVGYHARMTANGATLNDVALANFSITCALLSVELLARVEDELKGLREDLRVQQAVSKGEGLFPHR